jgi:hypothetical protein
VVVAVADYDDDLFDVDGEGRGYDKFDNSNRRTTTAATKQQPQQKSPITAVTANTLSKHTHGQILRSRCDALELDIHTISKRPRKL